MKPEYILDGRRTTTLIAFYDEIGQVLLAGQLWGESLEALDQFYEEIMDSCLKRSD